MHLPSHRAGSNSPPQQVLHLALDLLRSGSKSLLLLFDLTRTTIPCIAEHPFREFERRLCGNDPLQHIVEGVFDLVLRRRLPFFSAASVVAKIVGLLPVSWTAG
ncbi:hypothetical protein [Phaeovulum sp. NW3]|uniref:hypothetical protein n=1 Tax=Phaeovulum sp. NW3 TaxID=2934933 RepID=UPI002021DD0C|nr:hypothetical protein [Phaeovulum sp. NW3]MCL7466703.1 hypothetical protein [Phaeovulum sp. NW3]